VLPGECQDIAAHESKEVQNVLEQVQELGSN
jgi:hypothetical protein